MPSFCFSLYVVFPHYIFDYAVFENAMHHPSFCFSLKSPFVFFYHSSVVVDSSSKMPCTVDPYQLAQLIPNDL